MRPERVPEHLLDQQKPWYPVNQVSDSLWQIFKAKLTGRPLPDGTSYSSTLNLPEKTADELIQNLKDMGEYPVFNQNLSGMDWYEGYQAFQTWLLEEYLQKPFERKLEAKLLEVEVKHIEKRKKNNSPKKEVEEVVETLIDQQPIRENVSPEITEILPYIEPAAEELKIPIPEEKKEDFSDTPTEKNEFELAPITLSVDIQKSIDKYSSLLEKISGELSVQTGIIRKINTSNRHLTFNFGIVEFLLGQQIENYQEAIDDFETRQRQNQIRLEAKVQKTKIASTISQSTATTPKPVEPTPKSNTGKLSAGGFLNTPFPAFSGGALYPSTPLPGLSAGGISQSQTTDKVLEPGVYDSPTVGSLLPGTAVIPFNRNYGKKLLGVSQPENMQKLGNAMRIPVNALVSSVASNLGDFLRSSGPLSPYFNVYIKGLVQSLSKILDVPKNIVLDLLGGPVYADKLSEEEYDEFYRLWKQVLNDNNWYFSGGSSAGGGAPPPGGGQVFKDIYTISGTKDFRVVSGTNTGALPAWIPFPNSVKGQVGFTSGYGMRLSPTSGTYKMHPGMDLDGNSGLPIISPFSGIVSDLNNRWPSDRGGGYGNFVEIQHDQPKVFTFYAHLSEVANGLQRGSKITAGQQIGKLGNTGNSTGPHLHWEVRMGSWGSKVDPVSFTHSNKSSAGITEPPPRTDKPNKKAPKGPSARGYGGGGMEDGGSVGSFASGGWMQNLTNIAKRFLPSSAPPKGLRSAPMRPMYSGVPHGVDDIIRNALASGKSGFKESSGGMLGKGVYSSFKHWVADSYSGASKWSILKGLPGRKGGGPIMEMLMPSGAGKSLRGATAIPGEYADKALMLADKLKAGEYAKSAKAAEMLGILQGAAKPSFLRSTATTLTKSLRFFGKALPILDMPVVGDMILPEAAGGYDQLSGSNAYYNSPTYKAPTPTATKRNPVVINMPSPQTPPIVPQQQSSTAPVFVKIDIPTNEILNSDRLKRL